MDKLHTCVTCKSWKNTPGYIRCRCTKEHGLLCMVLTDEDSCIIAANGVTDDASSYFVTAPDYGCVLWESERG